MEFGSTLKLEVQPVETIWVFGPQSDPHIFKFQQDLCKVSQSILSYGVPSTPTPFALAWVQVCGIARKGGRRNSQDVQTICPLKYFSSLCNLECGPQECSTILGLDNFNHEQVWMSVMKIAADLGPQTEVKDTFPHALLPVPAWCNCVNKD